MNEDSKARARIVGRQGYKEGKPRSHGESVFGQAPDLAAAWESGWDEVCAEGAGANATDADLNRWRRLGDIARDLAALVKEAADRRKDPEQLQPTGTAVMVKQFTVTVRKVSEARMYVWAEDEQRAMAEANSMLRRATVGSLTWKEDVGEIVSVRRTPDSERGR
jgi:hypothetical protein